MNEEYKEVEESVGMGFVGSINITYNELVNKLGLPHKDKRMTRSTALWCFEYKGTRFSIYDYEKGSVRKEDQTDWHIGGYNSDAVEVVQDLFPEHVSDMA